MLVGSFVLLVEKVMLFLFYYSVDRNVATFPSTVSGI